MRTSYRAGEAELPRQLFTLFVENLLGGYPLVPGGSELVRERWNKVKKTVPASRWPKRIRDANRVADPLNQALAGFLDRTREEANRLLVTHFPNHRLVITGLAHAGCRFRKDDKALTGQSILAEIEYNGRKVERHEEFLNEARLTALGLSMFLAALKLADYNPTDTDALRLLVLDDVLIGLDIANRLPLLELLRVEFPHHQTILITHDELCFNIAREHTQHWALWRSAQLFAESTGPTDPPFPRIKADKNDLTVAGDHLRPPGRPPDLRAAAVYIRAALESCLRRVCEKHSLRIGFRQNPREIKAEALWKAILRKHSEMVRQNKEFIDPVLIPRISAVRSNILNRLTHVGASGLVHQEVQDSLNTVAALRSATFPHRP